MQRTKDFELDGMQYKSTQYGATKGIKLLTKLSKLFAKPIAVLSVGGGLDAKLTPDLIGSALDGVLTELNEDEFDLLIKRVLETTQTQNNDTWVPITGNYFDVHFAGKYGHMFKLLKEVLGFQYNDFLSGITSLQEKLVAPTAKK